MSMTNDDPDQKRRGRGKRILLWVLLIGGVMGLVSLTGLYLGRRPLATRIVQRQLRAVGGKGVTFRVAALGSGETRIENVRVGKTGARIASAGISYSPSGLLALRFKEASVLGAEVEVRREQAGWSIPLLDWIAGLELPPPDPTKPKSFYADLPKARLDAAVRIIHHALGEWQLPLTVSARISPQRLRAKGKLQVLGNEETVEADLDPDLTGDLHVEGRVADLSVLHRLCQYADVVLPVELLTGGDGVRVSASASLDMGRLAAGKAELTLAGSRCRWRGEEFGLGKLHVVARSTSGDLTNWQVESEAEGLGGYGVAISELRVNAAGSPQDGMAELIACRFRYGSLAGVLSGKLHWQEGRRLSGTLHVQELSCGGLTINDASLSVEGVPEAMDWALQWHDEEGFYGLRNLRLAGRASLTGEPGSTVSGTATVAVGAALESVGLTGWAGETTVEVLAGSSVRLATDGVVWEARLKASCPELAGVVGAVRVGASGWQAGLTGKGTAANADGSATVTLPNVALTLGDLGVGATGIRLDVQGSALTLGDLTALARSPREPFAKDSLASLVADAKVERCETDLAQLAKAGGRAGLLAGEAIVSEFSANVNWQAGAVSVAAALAGECPDLSVSPTAGWRVRAPVKFRLKASGTPQTLAGEGNLVGDEAGVSMGGAETVTGSWQGDVSFAGLSPEGMAGLTSRLSEGSKLPEGTRLDASLNLTQTTLEVAQWAGLATRAALGGQVELTTVDASLRGDEQGLSGVLAASGKGHKLTLDSSTTGKLGGDAAFSVQLKGAPHSLSGSVDVDLTSPTWRHGETAASATRLRVSANGVGLTRDVVSSWLRDPFGVDGRGGPGRASVSLVLENGTVAGLADGISLSTTALHWSPSGGWQTADDVRLQVNELGMRGLRVKGLTAQASLRGGTVQAKAALPLAGPGVTAVFAGAGQLAPCPAGSGTLTVPEFAFSTDQGWVLGLGLFGDLEFSGKVSANAEATWSGRDLACNVGVALHEGEATLPGDSGEINGLEVGLKLDLLPDMISRPHQTLRFSRVKAGSLSFVDGRARFQIDGPGRLFVEEAHTGWCGGILDTYALRIDTAKTDMGAVVYARDVDVGEFIRLFPDVQGSGEGRLYGRLPAFRRNGRYGYGDGFLYSIPGEHGRLQLRELGALAPAVRAMGATGLIVEDSLRDLDYSLFRVDIRPKGHRDQGVRIRVFGTKAGQDDAKPVDLNVNVLGDIEEALNLGLKIGGMKQILENAAKLQRLLRKIIE
jgi:hypothetical protein